MRLWSGYVCVLPGERRLLALWLAAPNVSFGTAFAHHAADCQVGAVVTREDRRMKLSVAKSKIWYLEILFGPSTAASVSLLITTASGLNALRHYFRCLGGGCGVGRHFGITPYRH